MKTKICSILGLLIVGLAVAKGNQSDRSKTNGKLIVDTLAPEEIRYTGKPYNKELSAYVFNCRNYDPEISRWTTPDLSGFPDGANNQSYAPTPTNQVDFRGMFTVSVSSSVHAPDALNASSGGHSYTVNMNWPVATDTNATAITAAITAQGANWSAVYVPNSAGSMTVSSYSTYSEGDGLSADHPLLMGGGIAVTLAGLPVLSSGSGSVYELAQLVTVNGARRPLTNHLEFPHLPGDTSTRPVSDTAGGTTVNWSGQLWAIEVTTTTVGSVNYYSVVVFGGVDWGWKLSQTE